MNKKRNHKISIGKFNIIFSNRVLYSLIAVLIVLIVGVGVWAYGTSNPSVFGHSAGEIGDLPASKITSGTFDAARIPNLDASKIPNLDASKIPNLDASKITSGTFGTGSFPYLDIRSDNGISTNKNYIRGLSDHLVIQAGDRGSGDLYLNYRGDGLSLGRVIIGGNVNIGGRITGAGIGYQICSNTLYGDLYYTVTCPAGKLRGYMIAP